MFKWVLNTSLLGRKTLPNLQQFSFIIPWKNNFYSQDFSSFLFLLNLQTSKSETSILALLQIKSYPHSIVS